MTEDIKAKKEKLFEMLKYFYKEQNNLNEEKVIDLIMEMKRLSPDPELTDYMFWPNFKGYDRELTPEEVVDICFSYKPIIL